MEPIMPINHNQTWDSEGNLVLDELVEVPEPYTPKLEEIAQSAGLNIEELLSKVQQFLKEQE
jgi:hypothetical protein